jgi:hypothetical protein
MTWGNLDHPQAVQEELANLDARVKEVALKALVGRMNLCPPAKNRLNLDQTIVARPMNSGSHLEACYFHLSRGEQPEERSV